MYDRSIHTGFIIFQIAVLIVRYIMVLENVMNDNKDYVCLFKMDSTYLSSKQSLESESPYACGGAYDIIGRLIIDCLHHGQVRLLDVISQRADFKSPTNHSTRFLNFYISVFAFHLS